MRVTYNWLRDYVDLDLSPEDLAERLTMVGLEVEEIEDRYTYLDQVVAARVAAVEDHPRSNHLKVCRVETDRDSFQVVCGAPNVAPGLVSPLALVGTQLAGGPVSEAEIRGVHSIGMLCSEAELMVGPDAGGIMVLPETARPGQKLKEVLGLADWAFEVGVTPNRPDCLSVIGLAREVAGILGQKMKYPKIDLIEAEERIEDQTSVTILSPEHCPRYVARVIRGVKIGPSPFWMVDRLAGVGLRSINNVVDITNFVLMEVGQPLHSFDMDRLDERRIVVQTAKAGQRFVTLDGMERILSSDMLLICDARQGVALAGIMGGLNSEIVPETTNVLLESAYFNPVGIRRTSKALGLSTEASFRFERGIDPDGCLFAADRAAALMAALAGGRISSGLIDAYPKVQPKTIVPFSPARCNAFLGTGFEPEPMVRTLEGIELKISGSGEDRVVDVPSFRVDLTREVDLFEEVARLSGYDQVPATLPPARAETLIPDPSLRLRSEIRNILEGLGLSEVVTYSFIFEGFADKLNLPQDDERRETVRIINPLSDEQSLMRTTLVPSLLETLRRNQAFKVEDVSIFEIGKGYFRRDGQELPDERLQVGGLMTGSRTGLSWYDQIRPVDFYDVKGVIEDLLESLKTTEPSFDRLALPAYYDEAASARVSVNGRTVGWLGRLAPAAAASFDLRETPFIFELELSPLLDIRQAAPRFSPLPRYPSVERDIALVLDREIEAGQILEYISGLGEEYLTDVALFDAYEGPQVGQGARSLAFRLTYRSGEKTLTDEEVNAVHKKITERLIQTFSAKLRT